MRLLLTLTFLTNLLFSATFSVSTVSALQNALTTAQSNGENDRIEIANNTSSYSVSSTLTFNSTEAYNLEIVGIGTVSFNGGGTTQIFNIVSTNAKVTFRNIRFVSGSSTNGGALYLDTASEIFDCWFNGNNASSWGGAILLEETRRMLLMNSKISNNSACCGAGIFAKNNTQVVIVNSVFAFNTSQNNGGAMQQYSSGGMSWIFNTIFQGNTKIDFNGDNLHYTGATSEIYNSYLVDSIDSIYVTNSTVAKTALISTGLSWTVNYDPESVSSTNGTGMPFLDIISIVDNDFAEVINSNYGGSPENFLNMGATLTYSPGASLVNFGSIISASLDLTFYDKIRIEFNLTNEDTITNFTNELSNDEVFVKNSKTSEKVFLNFDTNFSNTVLLSVRDQAGINILKGKSLDNLKLHFNDPTFDDSNVSADFNLTKTLGSTIFGDLAVENDKWNLIAIPQGLHTNSREIIKSGKATLIWGWEFNGTNYEWVKYPKKMVSGRGYWVKTRVSGNTNGTLSDVIATDYNTTVFGDYNNSEINTSNFIEVLKLTPKKESWTLLGNSANSVSIVSNSGSENNSSSYYFRDLLNDKEDCYFLSIYLWKPDTETWVNNTYGGNSTEAIPFGKGFWARQQLCNK
jgi:hypothetical protein